MRKAFRYGKKIRQCREAHAWTQEQLALAADIETRTVQRVEKDLTKSPETLQAIAGAFNVDLDSLRSTWLIPESRLIRTSFVTEYRQFINVEETHAWHAYSRLIMAPLSEKGLELVEQSLGELFAGRELIEPDETELWNAYVKEIEKPLESLFEHNLAFYVMDERGDLLLGNDGALKAEKSYMDDWRVRHFVLVPRHGCFRLGSSEPLHRFDEDCPSSKDALFRAVTQRNTPDAHVVADALVAITAPTFVGTGINWCDICFPVLEDGSRLNFDYIERVTGLDRAKLHSMWEESTGESFLHGLV